MAFFRLPNFILTSIPISNSQSFSLSLTVFPSVHSPGILWPELGVATVVPAAPGEGVVAALELARHLFVGGPAARHQHHVEAGEPEHRNGQDRDQCHQHETAI